MHYDSVLHVPHIHVPQKEYTFPHNSTSLTNTKKMHTTRTKGEGLLVGGKCWLVKTALTNTKVNEVCNVHVLRKVIVPCDQ